MKLRYLIPLYAVISVLIVYLVVVGYVFHYDKTRADLPSLAGLSKQNFQIQKILNDRGCSYCHIAGANMPFYARLPFVKGLMDKDVANGTAHFYLAEVQDSMEKNKPVPEADLAKIETVMLDQSMPPKLFNFMHWASFISQNERRTVLNWVKDQRATYYASKNAAENMKNEPVRPLPRKLRFNVNKALLGEKLFHDTRLSGDNTVSCSSCHNLKKGGVDGLQTSTGIYGQEGPINAPTVFNAVFNHKQFWNGRAATLAEQAGGPPLNPVEMGSKSFDEIVTRLNEDENFKQQFSRVYPKGFSEVAIKDAIAEFEKTLLTPSPFDRYLEGDKNAISPEQKHGYALFKENRCSTCHVGVNFGGQSFEPLGLDHPFFDSTMQITNEDLGTYALTQKERDRYRQKVPSLRNLSLTAPYFHRGDVETLHEAVEKMLEYQVGKTLPQQDVDDIVSFLMSLDGVYTRDLPPPLD